MSTPCQVTSPNLQKLDPLKRVNYTFGLVLGVEEFVQSDTYFIHKHHVENRLLHGYGTVCGLDVVTETAPVLEVQVTPGWALTPRGQQIKVPQVMCVQVNEWLAANLAELQSLLVQTTPPSALNLCVVLCYRECKTDVVPIPGQPCMTQTSAMAPSRIADSFDLMLCLDYTTSPPLSSPPSTPASGGLCQSPPLQLEDDSVAALAALLSEFQIAAPGPANLTMAQVEELVLNLNQPLASPPVVLPPGPPYLVSAADAADLRRAAIRTWVTQVRPFICSSQGSGPCCPPPEKCVLLAELAVDLSGGASEWLASSVVVDDSRRPFLVPTMLLQEMVLAQAAALTANTAYQAVAAGYFSMTGAPIQPSFNNLTATAISPPNDEYLLNFSGYQATSQYIVKGTVQGAATPVANSTPATIELVDFENGGIRIRIRGSSAPAPVEVGFMAEVSEIGGAS